MNKINCSFSLDILPKRSTRNSELISNSDGIGKDGKLSDTPKVYLGDLLNSKEFQKSKAKLPIPFGLTAENKVIVEDLFWMVDILIGGLTGTGKTTLINSIIASLMFAKRPDQLKFVIIDLNKDEYSYLSELQYSYLATFNKKPAIIHDIEDVLPLLESLIIERDKRHKIAR